MNNKVLDAGVGILSGTFVGFILPGNFQDDILKTAILATLGWGITRGLNTLSAKYEKWKNEKSTK